MNDLKFVNVSKSNQEVRKLYEEAFPQNEKMPYLLLLYYSKKRNADFYGIYDNQIFVGLVYSVYYQDIVYIFYFAIDESLRAKGYGSKCLEMLKQKYFDKRVVLSIEELNEDSDNNQQRIKRKVFYQRNGFNSLNIKVKEGSVTYELLYYSNSNLRVTKEEYDNLLKTYFGSFIFKIFYWFSR